MGKGKGNEVRGLLRHCYDFYAGLTKAANGPYRFWGGLLKIIAYLMALSHNYPACACLRLFVCVCWRFIQLR